jgi:hypothetical protein
MLRGSNPAFPTHLSQKASPVFETRDSLAVQRGQARPTDIRSRIPNFFPFVSPRQITTFYLARRAPCLLNIIHIAEGKFNMNGVLVQPEQVLKRDADSFLHRTVQDLFSLKGRTIVVTGGARGIGLSFGFAIAEAGGNVAILDALPEPHEHYYKLQKGYGVKVQLYKYVTETRIFSQLLILC